MESTDEDTENGHEVSALIRVERKNKSATADRIDIIQPKKHTPYYFGRHGIE